MTAPAAFVPRKILVDDNDTNSITYSQGWYLDLDTEVKIIIYGTAYNKTIHKTNGTGSFSLTFEFSGTMLEVMGISIGTPANQTRDPILGCSMDQNTFANSTATTNTDLSEQWHLCSASNLADEKHTFILDVSSNGQPARFDYMLYVPSADVPLDNAIIKVDSTDPSIQYSGSDWSDLKGIANMTQTSGGYATFNFIGKSLQWFGHVPSELPRAPASGSYAIDGGQPQNFTLPGLSGANPQSLYNQLFFATPDLTPGSHQLEVWFWGNIATTPLSLDYLLVQNATVTSSGSPGGATPGSGNGAQSASHSSGISTGAIAGIIVACIFSVAIALFAFIFYRRNYSRSPRQRESILGAEIGRGPGFEATPFVLPPSTAASDAAVLLPSQPQVMTQVGGGSVVAGHQARGVGSGKAAFANDLSPVRAPDFEEVQTVRHQDSGIRLRPNQPVPVVEEPPNYTRD